MGTRLVIPVNPEEGTGFECRVYASHVIGHIPDFVKQVPPRADYQQFTAPTEKRIVAWIHSNCDAHAPFVSEETSLERLFGKYEGKTLVLVLAGPSAKGIQDRLRPYRDHPDVLVATLGNTIKAVPDCDFHMCFEQLGNLEWWTDVDPNRTTLITTPAARDVLAEKWGGENVFYGYMADMRQPVDERWKSLPLLISAMATCIPSLQAFYHMGFANILIVGADFAIAEPKMAASNRRQIYEGEFYWDGTRYCMDGNAEGSYYNGQPMSLFIGVDGKFCGANQWFLMHRDATKCCMEILGDGGVNIKNCSEQGILDHNCANLEESLNEILAMSDAMAQAVEG